MTFEQRSFLDRAPLSVGANYIADYCSDDVGITSTTFMLSMAHEMREADPVEVFDYWVARIRDRVLYRVSGG